MPRQIRPIAALVLMDGTAPNRDLLLAGIAEVLRRLDASSGRPPRVSEQPGAASGDTLLVRLEMSAPQSGAGRRVIFQIAARPGLPALAAPRAAEVLAELVMRALDVTSARELEWLSPEIRLSPAEFRAARSYVSARRARATLPGPAAAAPPPPVRSSARPPASRADDVCITGIRDRAAGWAMTALVGTVSMPVALALSALHAIRGAEFRVSAHALALAGTASLLWQAGLLDPVIRLSGP